MGWGRAIRRKLRAAVAPVIFLAVTGYFGWNVTQGDLGLKAYAARQQDLVLAQAGLARAQAEAAAWERRVLALRTTQIDGDALDERARAMLNLADPNDLVVPYAQEAHLF